MPRPFVHLHLHSQYSLLDGAIKIDPLFQRAKSLNMPAVGLTDHGLNAWEAGVVRRIGAFADRVVLETNPALVRSLRTAR